MNHNLNGIRTLEVEHSVCETVSKRNIVHGVDSVECVCHCREEIII